MNKLHLQAVTRDNFYDVINLKVKLRQRDFVGSNQYSLAEAYVKPECVPLAVYNGTTLVGFTMYCRSQTQSNKIWIYRVMIGARYQHRGYGSEAMRLLIEHIKNEFKTGDYENEVGEIYISVNPQNHIARDLYLTLGFVLTGEMEEGEEVLKLTIE